MGAAAGATAAVVVTVGVLHLDDPQAPAPVRRTPSPGWFPEDPKPTPPTGRDPTLLPPAPGRPTPPHAIPA